MHYIKKVIDIIICPKYYCYFITNISNSYWTVCIKHGYKYKAGFIILYS